MEKKKLTELLGSVEVSVGHMGTSAYDMGAALRSIFLLNNEIGRLARAGPAEKEKMTALQTWVNSVTRAVKQGRKDRALSALDAAKAALAEIVRPEAD